MKDAYPMRINQYLAKKGYATRRGADELIEKKLVLINGRFAVLGDKVNEGDAVEVRPNKKAKIYEYYAYNKGIGVATESINILGLFPVGRLDKESHGLIILTNDGRITDRLLNPIHTHDKEYIVEVKEKLRGNFKDKMEAGVQIEEEKTAPCKVQILGDRKFSVVLTEGKKHQIRRMCSALFAEVDGLKRVRIMNISLGNLGSNQYRKIEGEELSIFLKSLGL
jgi:23S rRNA pseudouridine2604 synthase